MSESVSSHPQLRAVQEENIVQEIEDELSSDLHSTEAFFDPSVTQPNAQVSGKVASAQQKTSQANAMRRFGLHAQQSQRPILNHADANGNYLGTGLGLKDDPKIDDFDPNAYGSENSSSGVNKMPSTSGSSASKIMRFMSELGNANAGTNFLVPPISSGGTSFEKHALQELVKEIREGTAYAKTAGEALDKQGENYAKMENNYRTLGSQLSDVSHQIGLSNPGNEMSLSEIAFGAKAQEMFSVASECSAMAVAMSGGGKALIAASFGLQAKIAYDNVQTAPPDLRTAMEVKEYGGIGAGVIGAGVGVAVLPRAPVVGSLIGDLIGMSLWKAGVDDYETRLAPNHTNLRNGF